MFASRVAIRQFAKAAAPAAHAPPKKVHGATGKYAMAVYTAASKANNLEKVESELQAVATLLNKNAAFAGFFANPTVPRSEKVAVVDGMFDKKFSDITRNLMLTLSANGRVGETSKVISAFDELMQASRGLVEVTIISAEPLKKKQLETIQASLGKFVGDKAVDVKVEVQPSILGGLQIQVGDRFLDLSVASRVNTLTQTMASGSL